MKIAVALIACILFFEGCDNIRTNKACPADGVAYDTCYEIMRVDSVLGAMHRDSISINVYVKDGDTTTTAVVINEPPPPPAPDTTVTPLAK